MKTVLKRLAGFTGFPLIALIAPFLLLPVISRFLVDGGWANYTAGQAIGTLGAIGTLFGWGVLGPVRIAKAESWAEQQRIYRLSLHTRLSVIAVTLPAVVIVTTVVTSDSFRFEAILMAVSGVLVGLSPNWFCIGIGRPMLMGKYDAIPRLVVSLGAVPVLIATGWVWFYPIALIAVSIGSVVLFSRMVLSGSTRERFSLKTVWSELRFLLPTALIDFTGNSYGSTPVPISTATLPKTTADSFSSAERLYRISIMAVTALGDAFQGWVLEPTATSPLKRHFAAIVAHTALGLIGGTLIAILGPWATGLVFSQANAATAGQSLFFGLSLFFISVTTPLIRNIMIPAARFRQVFTATVIAAVIGLIAMISFGVAGSSEGIAAGLAASEMLIFAVLLPFAIIELRKVARTQRPEADA